MGKYNFIFNFPYFLDKRTENYFLGDSPFLIVALTFAYYFFVKKYGPEYMKNRPAYNINRLLIVYNVAQIIMNAYIFAGVSTKFLVIKNIYLCTFRQ